MEKYKQNLRIENNKVYSYNTLVARINKGETHLTIIDWKENRDWNGKNEDITTSPTTTKHINYVAKELNLIINK
jgi:hypothetical protein|tara:strand:- start:76 stop:297 length:222 start_codon:yes stop_codon:yes gene_type:complete